MDNKPKQKNRKLLIQIAFIVIPLFIVMFAAALYSMYTGSVKGFLEAQNEYMSEVLEKESKMAVFSHSFYLDYWESHPELTEPDLSAPDKYVVESYFGSNGWKKAAEWISDQSDRMKQYLAYYSYRYLISILELDDENKKYESLFVIDIENGNEGFVFWEMRMDSDPKGLGDYFKLDVSDHSVLEKLLDEPSEEIVFEQTDNFIADGSQYIGYKPIVFGGKVRAVIGVSYDWSEMRTSLLRTARSTFLIGLGGMAAAMVILLLVLKRKAVAPVRRIQEGVCEYIETKDSAAVISKMSQIKERNEFGLLSDNISELANAIDRYTGEIVTLTGERERVAAELDMAKSIQAGQLPSVFPAFPERTEFDIYATMTPAKEVGGDFYDFFLVDDDHLAMVIADVSGKGVPAALFMMMSKMLISNFAAMGLSPAEVLTRTNETIYSNNKEKMFVTVWLGILEMSTGKVTAANAGHEYPMLRQADGDFELFKDKHGFVIGGFKGKKYKQYKFTMQKGAALFVYTDGVAEARNADKKMFGTDRIIQALNKAPDASPQELLENVHNDVNAFVGEAPQFDDLTMLGIKLI